MHPLSTQSLARTSDSSRIAEAGSTDSGFEIIPSLGDKPSPRRQINLPCILLEPPDQKRVFFGRDDVLDVIRDALVPFSQDNRDVQDLRQFALCGLGGIGKTEIALEFVLKYKDEFDAVFWVRADEPAKLDECFKEISINLGLQTAEEATNQVVSRSLVKGWLANPTKEYVAAGDADATDISVNRASWLIIFDNADDPKAIGDHWPLGSGSVLITSRDPLAKSLFSSYSSGLDLGSLSDIDGGALLLRLTESDESLERDAENLAQRISRSLAGLPLAISQMAGIIRQKKLNFHEFLSIYEDTGGRAQLYGTKYDASPKAYRYNIATVWALEKLSLDAKELLKVISFMDPDIIQEAVLFDVVEAIFADTSFAKLRCSNARTELTQTSLIKRDKRQDVLSEYRISVHRLVQDAVLSTMSNEEITSTFTILVKTLWEKWPTAFIAPTKFSPILDHRESNTRYQVGRFPTCAGLYPHIIRLKQLWPLASSSTRETKIRLAALLNDAAWYQSERGRTRDLDGFWILAQALCESVLGDESNTILADIHFSLGSNDAMINQHSSSRHHKDAFFSIQKSICESIAPDFVDERLGLAYAEIGISYTQDRRLDDAIEAYTRGREIRRKLGNTALLSRDANLAIAYMDRGDLVLAEEILTEGLGLTESTTGAKESHRAARFRSAVGNLRSLQGRLDEAYQEHFKALQLYIDTVGWTNQRTAEARHKVAEHFIRMQRYDEAITMINEALKIWDYDASVYKPELARTTFLKARLLEQLGETQKANIAFQAAQRLRDDVVPNDKRDVRSLEPEDFDCLLAFWSR
ncbi:tetratricopeptide repeat domain-containing protein [Nemania sp. FL0031]|nr:tetratricopeptide repeat domain-containing protein [Nemania sp. FL0031]